MDICQWIDENQSLFTQATDKIWGFAELKFEEHQSAKVLKDMLRINGFAVQEGVADIETAFIAEYGSGEPIIGILAEYDALSQMSQKADSLVKEKESEMQNGHGCGHHLLGGASTAAAIAVKEYLTDQNLSGTIRIYGCPGEEGGGGKTFMARSGVFDDLDCAFTWHPSSMNQAANVSTIANIQAYFHFYGKSSHAAVSPHLGRSALDAVELMNVGVNYLREHIIPEARVHYAVTYTGGQSPNVVQAESEVLYLIRAPHMNQVQEIYERIINIANGAALMTGTKVVVTFDKACSDIIPNDTLGRVMYEKMKLVGVPEFTDEEKSYASYYINTFSADEKDGNEQLLGALGGSSQEMGRHMMLNRDKPLMDDVMPYFFLNASMPGSSDVGDVSWITPTTQCATTCYAASTPNHSWQLVAQGKSSIAHKGMLYAAKVMALSAVEIYLHPEIAENAKEELKKHLGEKTYISPIPAGIKPKPYQ